MARSICAAGVAGENNPQRAVFSALVCLCDEPEMVATRTELWKRVQVVSRDFKEPDLRKLMAWLRRERRGYAPASDGVSPIMTLVDAITALEAECEQAVERLAVP